MEKSETHDEQEALESIREAREAKLERAFGRLARFELQAVPALTLKEGTQKHTMSLDTDGTIKVMVEPLKLRELGEVDEAISVINEISKVDDDIVNEVERRVADEVRERLERNTPEHAESIETLKYVSDLQDAVDETFNSYEEAIAWEQEECGAGLWMEDGNIMGSVFLSDGAREDSGLDLER